MAAGRLTVFGFGWGVLMAPAKAQHSYIAHRAVHGVDREDRGQQDGEESRQHVSRSLSVDLPIRNKLRVA